MDPYFLKKTNTLTSDDITNLLCRFGEKDQQYVEIVDVQKNIQTINKYPLLKDIMLSIKCTYPTQQPQKI